MNGVACNKYRARENFKKTVLEEKYNNRWQARKSSKRKCLRRNACNRSQAPPRNFHWWQGWIKSHYVLIFLTAEWQNHPETKEIALLQERHTESRRLRQQENEADEFPSNLLAPPGRGKRDERPSSDGDDEQEGEETDVVSSNPFALLSDE